MLPASPDLPAQISLPEPELLFHPARLDDTSKHPLEGLLKFGPFSRSTLSPIVDPIRVAIIAPAGQLPTAQGLIRELEQQHQPRERRDYLRPYDGFTRIFRTGIVAAASSVQIELPRDLSARIHSEATPHLALADELTRAIGRLKARRAEFDVLLIYLPDDWEPAFEGGKQDDFDLHDYVKSVTAASDIPSQIAVERSALSYYCRASVCWRLGIALYTKAGGIPWKLAHTPADTAYLGLSYSLNANNGRSPRFVNCCSQVFDANGGGLEFIAYETDPASWDHRHENPYLSREDMRRVMARSLSLYQKQHGGEAPKRVVVHKTTEFKPEEVDGCFDVLNVAEVQLLQIQEDVPWRGIAYDMPGRPNARSQPSFYPCKRGTMVQLGGREVLLWTSGNAPDVAGGRNYFKEGKGIPAPLLIRRFAGHGPAEDDCLGILGLTKMDWNNDSLYDRVPVTLAYAKILARTIRRMPNLAQIPYQFRFFM